MARHSQILILKHFSVNDNDTTNHLIKSVNGTKSIEIATSFEENHIFSPLVSLFKSLEEEEPRSKSEQRPKYQLFARCTFG